MTTPLVLATSIANPLIMPSLAPVSIGGEVAAMVAQALHPPSDNAGLLEEVPMKVENITTLSNVAFLVETIVPVERTPERP